MRDIVYQRQRGHGRPAAPRPARAPTESTLCRRCGAAYRSKTWHRPPSRSAPVVRRKALIAVCPACLQIEKSRYLGRVLLRGSLASANSEAIRRRVANVAARDRFTQPERRLVSMRQDGEGLEVVTTSETLAHRIVREIEKAFGGVTSYARSHREQTLLAVWQGGNKPSGARIKKGRTR